MATKMAIYLTGWTCVQLHKFVSTRDLSAYFQDNSVWHIEHIPSVGNGRLNTRVYIKDPEQALLFKLGFQA